MEQFVRTVLNDKDLRIDEFKTKDGQNTFIGFSERYYPHKATSASSAMQCLMKFSITLTEQKRLAGLLVE
jgi:hypothetical protein